MSIGEDVDSSNASSCSVVPEASSLALEGCEVVVGVLKEKGGRGVTSSGVRVVKERDKGKSSGIGVVKKGVGRGKGKGLVVVEPKMRGGNRKKVELSSLGSECR
ncbi:hypothetical protein VNO78_13579 [Psophocarpus tetragonolobus]|uniref:Uncharacterized protein n=1 Tax=Psophocarpus tetragonolobus TaxID=3891 RepID=A0AAN9XQJ6_PSOTE